MTETSPLCALALPPRGTPPEEEIEWRAKTGRVVFGVEVRVAAEDGSILPDDGASVGEFEVRGPWVTGSYYGEPSPERFHDGWLRTGDIGSLDERGYMQISDRTKDVIKSGGEWISSVELENEVMAHPGVVEAAVIAVPDERWSERPLVAVVARRGFGRRRRRAGRVPLRTGQPMVVARAMGVHRRGAQDQRGQVRQEGAPVPARRGRPAGHRGREQGRALIPWLPIWPTSPSACPASARSLPIWPSTACARRPSRFGSGENPIPG